MKEWFQPALTYGVPVLLLLGCFVVQLFFYLYYYLSVWRKSRRLAKEGQPGQLEQPPVTVVVYARNQAMSLGKNLPAILEQTYPTFQVVVVNDASTDETEEVLVRLEQKYPHLYHTFVPPGIQSVSTRKMAMNIGIKAAKHDVLLFTEADCSPVSKEWIASVAGRFNKHCDVVFSYVSFLNAKGLLGLLASYDTLFSALEFMGFAEHGLPYMGFGKNLAYRKDLFFKNRGFASHLSLKTGEDDLFIGEVAGKSGTDIEVTPKSTMNVDTLDVWSCWKEQKRSHEATFSYYKPGIRFRIGLERISRLLFYSTTVVLLILGLVTGEWFLSVLSGGLFLIRYGVQFFVVNPGAKCFKKDLYVLSIPVFDVLIPIMGLGYRLELFFHKEHARTWQVLR